MFMFLVFDRISWPDCHCRCFDPGAEAGDDSEPLTFSLEAFSESDLQRYRESKLGQVALEGAKVELAPVDTTWQ